MTRVPTWDEFVSLEGRVATLEGNVPPPVASADGTKVTTAGPIVVDNQLNQWRLTSALQVQWMPAGTNAWVLAGTTANVAVLEKWMNTAYYETGTSWFSWNGTTWISAPGDPSVAPPMTWHVTGGKIVTPSGATFIAKGVVILDAVATVAVTDANCHPLLTDFPTVNFVLLEYISQAWQAPLPQTLANVVGWLTAKGIVVEIASYNTYPTVPVGDILTQEVNWFTSLAQIYIGNPLVWFSTCNEPQDTAQGEPAGSVTAEHVAVYNGIRSTGSKAFVGLNAVGSVQTAGLTPRSAYSTMTNVHWNAHYYNWIANFATDQPTNVTALNNEIADQQGIISADGTIPVVVAEFGNATDGKNVDAGGTASVGAVLQVALTAQCGCAAFVYPYWPVAMGGFPLADQLTDETTHALTAYGSQVKASY